MFRFVCYLDFDHEGMSRNDYLCTLYKYTELIDFCIEYGRDINTVLFSLIECGKYEDNHIRIYKGRIDGTRET